MPSGLRVQYMISVCVCGVWRLALVRHPRNHHLAWERLTATRKKYTCRAGYWLPWRHAGSLCDQAVLSTCIPFSLSFFSPVLFLTHYQTAETSSNLFFFFVFMRIVCDGHGEVSTGWPEGSVQVNFDPLPILVWSTDPCEIRPTLWPVRAHTHTHTHTLSIEAVRPIRTQSVHAAQNKDRGKTMTNNNNKKKESTTTLWESRDVTRAQASEMSILKLLRLFFSFMNSPVIENKWPTTKQRKLPSQTPSPWWRCSHRMAPWPVWWGSRPHYSPPAELVFIVVIFGLNVGFMWEDQRRRHWRGQSCHRDWQLSKPMEGGFIKKMSTPGSRFTIQLVGFGKRQG